MCKIIGGLGIKNARKFKKLLELNERYIGAEPDGFGFVSDQEYYRSVYDYRVTTVNFNKFFVMHTRTATLGARDQSNVHGYRLGDWYFFHNGTATKYNYGYKGIPGFKVSSKSDSLIFFEKLYHVGITKENVRKLVQQRSFWGIGILINRKTGNVWLFNKDKPIRLYTDGKSGLCFSSFDIIESQETQGVDHYGFTFTRDKASSLPLHSEINDSIVRMTVDGELLSIDTVRLYQPNQVYAKPLPSYTGLPAQTLYNDYDDYDDNDIIS
jgi:hypothetical protein